MRPLPKADDQNKWAIQAKNKIKGEMKMKGMSSRQLAEKLSEMGMDMTEQSLNNKISRGGFSAAFYLQCLEGIRES